MKTALVLLSVVALSAHGQGAFQNLHFEATIIPQTQFLGLVNTADALTGWNAFNGSNSLLTQVAFRALIAGTQVALFGTNGLSGTSIEGLSVFLAGVGLNLPGGNSFEPAAGSIRQTGLVPVTARSILFEAKPGTAALVVSLGGQNVPFTALTTGPNYTSYGGDVSAFAGQSLDLGFTAGFYGTGWTLDSIMFSNQPIPEPSTWALLFAGVGLLFAHRGRQPRK